MLLMLIKFQEGHQLVLVHKIKIIIILIIIKKELAQPLFVPIFKQPLTLNIPKEIPFIEELVLYMILI